jgi:HKD family nuclease
LQVRWLILEILNQPETGNIGDRLKSILGGNDEHRFDTFSFLVAYVKTSGVNQLAPSIQQFKRTGRVKGVVGVSKHQQNTSVQGLQHLLPLCDELSVYCNENPNSTFHPKVYIFEKAGEKASVFVGSSNLTAGGLYTNYEANAHSDYDLTDESQATSFLSVKEMFNAYSNPSDFCKPLTSEYLAELYKDGYLSNEETEPHEAAEQGRLEAERPHRQFGSRRINPPSVARAQITLPDIDLGQASDQWAIKGGLLWRKQLTPRDLQIVTGRTAPTGGISLTQADFRVDGRVINQTTYFKDSVFADFTWRQDRARSRAVATNVTFNVRIMGVDCGQHVLTLRHNPRWEAGQHNYTTSISWGPLTRLIRRTALIDKTFSLYAPPANKKQPYYIEIS